MEKLNEKSKNVFLYSKDGSKNDVAIKAFEALKTALGNTVLTAENFKQFAADFQEFIKNNGIQAAPADDNDTNQENIATEKEADTILDNNKKEDTNSEQAQEGQAATQETNNSNSANTVNESLRKKPSSLLFSNKLN